jgi:GR25 family glycosyltransferase involved in LPS biosynthesis
MNAYYINLDSAEQRRELIEQQITSAGLPFEIKRFPAVLGANYADSNPSLSNGQWGCWLSHMGCIELAKSTHEHLLLIEDDELFNHSLTLIDDLVQQLSGTDWDMLYLDATIVEPEDQLHIARACKAQFLAGKKPTPLKLSLSATVYGTHAYIINQNSLSKISKILMKNAKSGIAIDNVLCAGIQEGLISAYISVPFLCAPGEESNNSQINAGEHAFAKGWFGFREVATLEFMNSNKDRYLKALEKATQETILQKINLTALEKFSPYVGKIQKLS